MIQLSINGQTHSVDVEPDTPLLWVLRDTLGLTGTKFGCGAALCAQILAAAIGFLRRSVQPARRKAPGVTPVLRRKWAVKWLWLE